MTGLKPTLLNQHTDLNQIQVPEKEYPWKYLALPEQILKTHLQDKTLKKIVLVRDLRDISISQVLHIERNLPGTWLREYEDALYGSLPLNKKLIFFMVQNIHYTTSPKKIAEQVLKCSSFPNTHVFKNVLVCRFENLIGPQGGGTSLLQKKELQKIAQFLNIPLTPCEIEKIAETLFGIDELLDYKWKKEYYRAGRIGGWRQFFTADALEHYDENLKSLNTKLGYK
ncbi:MAG: hypothetical protein S4CHLAM7_07040 [Chlamydiae bacterium]|nr:hypothetical protein [Chlamydiota bacterium]